MKVREGTQKKSVLAAVLLALSLSVSTAFAAAGAVQGLTFENHALVIDASKTGGKPQLRNWESRDGHTRTQMMVLDIPDMTADGTQLEALAGEILKRNPEIRRLIITSSGDNSLRVVMEVVEKPGESLAPSVSQSGNKIRLGLTPVIDEPMQQVSPTQPSQQDVKEAAKILDDEQQKKIDALQSELNQTREQLAALKQQTKTLEHDLADARKDDDSSRDTDKLKEKLEQAESLQKELVISNQELVKKNHQLENELETTNKHLTASLEENVRLEQKQEHKQEQKQDQKADKNKTALSGQQVSLEDYLLLQSRYQELETQQSENSASSDALRQANADLQKELARLRDELVLQKTIIREATPGSPENISNIKSALVQTALKLKEAQEELAKLKGTPETHVPVHHAQETVTQPQSQSQLEAMIRNEPGNYDAYMQLQSLYIANGEYDKAEAVLQNLLVVNPRMADAYYALAELYLIKNNPVNARASLETYRRLKPYDTRRINALEQQLSTNH